MKRRVILFVARWLLAHLEHRITKHRQRIARDLDMLNRMQTFDAEFGAGAWVIRQLKEDVQWRKARILHHAEMLRHTKIFLLRDGLGR